MIGFLTPEINNVWNKNQINSESQKKKQEEQSNTWLYIII